MHPVYLYKRVIIVLNGKTKAGEKAPGLGVLAIFQKHLSSFLAPTLGGSPPPITPAPGDRTPLTSIGTGTHMQPPHT